MNILFLKIYPLVLLVLFGVKESLAVMSLQLPGLSYGAGEPTTVEVDFIDTSDNPLYTLKGEVFVQSTPMQSNSLFLPNKLTGKDHIVRKIRIKAGESGMVLKIFDTTTASVPKLMVLMKSGFIMTKTPIEIDAVGVDDHQTIKQAEINWYNRDAAETQRLGGMKIGKIELHVERKDGTPLQPSLRFVPFMNTVNSQGSIAYPETMMAAMNSASSVPPGGVVIPSNAGASNVVLNMAQPPPPSQQQQQFPNAPPLLV